jgi:hypothetical protein
MMSINIALEAEQQQRVEADKAAVEAQIELETNLYTAGDFDGVIGIDPDPQKWSKLAYRSGFLAGLGRYYDQKYQVDLEVEPF